MTEESRYGSMTLRTLAMSVAESRNLSKAERELLLSEVQGRLIVASVAARTRRVGRGGFRRNRRCVAGGRATSRADRWPSRRL